MQQTQTPSRHKGVSSRFNFPITASERLPNASAGYVIKVEGKIDIKHYSSKLRPYFMWMLSPHYLWRQHPIDPKQFRLWRNKREAQKAIKQLKLRKEYSSPQCKMYVVDCSGKYVKVW